MGKVSTTRCGGTSGGSKKEYPREKVELLVELAVRVFATWQYADKECEENGSPFECDAARLRLYVDELKDLDDIAVVLEYEGSCTVNTSFSCVDCYACLEKVEGEVKDVFSWYIKAVKKWAEEFNVKYTCALKCDGERYAIIIRLADGHL